MKKSAIYKLLLAISVLFFCEYKVFAQSHLQFNTSIDSSIVYYSDSILKIPYSTGNVNVLDSAEAYLFSDDNITLEPGFTADSHNGCKSFFAMAFTSCNSGRVCNDEYIDNTNFDFYIPPAPIGIAPTGTSVLPYYGHRVCPWENLRGSCDHFNIHGSSANFVPTNALGVESDHSGTGIAYSGEVVYADPPAGFPVQPSEIIYQRLNRVLSPGTYYGEFYIALGSKCKYAVDQFGMYLSQFPMVSSSPVIQTSGTTLGNTSWVRVSGCFTTTSSNMFVSIGSRSTNHVTVNAGGSLYEAYYYLDDPAIVPFKVDAGPDVSVCSDKPIQIGKSNCLSILNTPGVTYHWSLVTGIFPAGLSNSNIYNPTVTITNPLSYTVSQIYQVTVTASNGCTATDFVTVFVHPKLDPTVQVTTTPGNCNGNCSGTATVLPSGGTPPYSYLWSSSSQSQTATNLCNGTYTLTITDLFGCTVTNQATISPTNLAVDAGANQNFCVGSTLYLEPTVLGGIDPYTYTWSPSTGLSSTTDISPSVTNIISTNSYTLTVTDQMGCEAKDFVTISFSNLTSPVADAGLDVQIPNEETCGHWPKYIGTPALSGLTYLWTATDNFILLNFTATMYSAMPLLSYPVNYYYVSLNNPPVEFTVHVTNSFGCQSSDKVIASYPACRVSHLNGNENTELDLVVIFPNPTSGEIKIVGENDIPFQVSIFNGLGDKVYSTHPNTESKDYSIDLKYLENGLYWVIIQENDGSFQRQKIIILH